MLYGLDSVKYASCKAHCCGCEDSGEPVEGSADIFGLIGYKLNGVCVHRQCGAADDGNKEARDKGDSNAPENLVALEADSAQEPVEVVEAETCDSHPDKCAD